MKDAPVIAESHPALRRVVAWIGPAFPTPGGRVERSVFLDQPVAVELFHLPHLRIGNGACAKGPPEHPVLVLHLQAGHGRIVDEALAADFARRGEQGRPPGLIFLLKLRIEKEDVDGLFLAVVSGQDRIIRFGRQAVEPVDGKDRVDALGLVRLDEVDQLLHAGRVDFAALVVNGHEHTRAIDAALGEQARRRRHRLAIVPFLRPGVHAPEAHRFSAVRMDEMPIARRDEAAFTGHGFIQRAKVQARIGREMIRRRRKGQTIPRSPAAPAWRFRPAY